MSPCVPPRVRRAFQAFALSMVSLLCLASVLAPTAHALSQRRLQTLQGDQGGGWFGYSVANAGDVNGDGYTDVIVGAPLALAIGRAYIYFGGPNADNTVDATLLSPAGVNGYFGTSVSGAGDVNGDGFADVIVGAYGYSSYTGRAYIYYGGVTPHTTADVTITGSAVGVEFGVSVAGAGDVNGDGYGDVIIGASYYNSGQGRAYVYLGGISMDTVADVTVTGENIGDSMGEVVAGVGDLNNDGYADVAVSAIAHNSNTGRVYVFFGGVSMDAVSDLTVTGETLSDTFGSSLCGPGDVNADGYADLAIMAHDYGSFAGRVYLYYGGPFMDAAVDLTITGQTNDGLASIGAGDFNSDGYRDLIVGTTVNRANIYFGGAFPNSGVDIGLEGDPSSGFGSAVAGLGDVNGDGFGDVVVGEYGFSSGLGRAMVVSLFPYNVVSPNGGETLIGGKPATLRWRGKDPADVSLSLDNGLTWNTLASSVGGAADDTLTVVIPNNATTQARLRISMNGATVTRATSDVSDGSFTIVEQTPPASAVSRLLWSFNGTAGSSTGTSCASVGDLNGDGATDIAVGAMAAGRVSVFFGGRTADNVPDVTLLSEAGNGSFGYSVSPAGDLNGDGYADMIVGAPSFSANAGRAYIYFGGAAMDATADIILVGASSEQLGWAVSGGVDFNGDGNPDVLATAPSSSAGAAGAGRAYVYYGGVGMDAVADWTFTYTSTGAQVGTVGLLNGDVNHDGFGDVVLGAPFAASNNGRVLVLLGGRSPDALADLTLSPAITTTGEQFGSAVACADLTGDGAADIAVRSYPANGTGRVSFFYGAALPDAVADAVLTGEATSVGLGAVLSTGDINDDGWADLLVLSSLYNAGRGRASAYFGGPGFDAEPDLNWYGAVINQAPSSMAAVGNFTGEGLGAVAMGTSSVNASAGRFDVFHVARCYVTGPNGGETWNVGALQSISWLGTTPMDVWLSVDGTATWTKLFANVGGEATNSVTLRVPHSPTRFASVRVTPADAAISGSDRSDSLFTISTSIALLGLSVAQAPQGGVGQVVSWRTDPGPADLSGYTLERADGADAAWQTLVTQTTATSYSDVSGTPASRYRLTAINGLGEAFVLGETAVRPLAALAAWPLPYRQGDLTVQFATAGRAGGAAAPTQVTVHDCTGRLVRVLAQGSYATGHQTATWNGLDMHGRRVPRGLYQIQSRTGGETYRLKLVVLQ